ncbi:MAG: CoA-binding protein [Alphaproteobacteria bacterium]|nr:CoA-binding protein [Alphaproteobacteria bacterium]
MKHDLRPFYAPRSVAVVGAGDRPTSSGGAVLHLLEKSGFVGEIVPVNPKGGTIRNLTVRASLRELDTPAELCVIVIRPDAILDAVREAIATGHRHLLILPGGFAEAGAEGLKRDAELRALADEAGLTVAGPNCAGIIHLTGKGVPTGMAATFLRALPPGPDKRGKSIALLSQSGALAEEIITKANAMAIPIGTAVSVGNAVQIGIADHLAYLAQDDGVAAVLLYIESPGDMRAFRAIARDATRKKPVVALIGGRTPPGGAAAKAHTGSAALDDAAATAFARDCGMVHATSLRRLLLAARGFARYPRGIGKRVLVLSNAGGPGVLCADRCAVEGLELAALPQAMAGRLRANLPAEATVGNPIDLLADAREDRFGLAFAAAMREGAGAFDAVLMIHVVPFMVDPAPVAAVLADRARSAELPLMHAMMGSLPGKEALYATMEAAGVPMFDDVEAMAETAGMLAAYPALRAP